VAAAGGGTCSAAADMSGPGNRAMNPQVAPGAVGLRRMRRPASGWAAARRPCRATAGIRSVSRPVWRSLRRSAGAGSPRLTSRVIEPRRACPKVALQAACRRPPRETFAVQKAGQVACPVLAGPETARRARRRARLGSARGSRAERTRPVALLPPADRRDAKCRPRGKPRRVRTKLSPAAPVPHPRRNTGMRA
jgi:hypothetical protein